MKLVSVEAETAALRRFLAPRPERATSVVGAVELARNLRRLLPIEDWADAVAIALSGVSVVEITPLVRWTAERLEPLGLRTLDAIHVATAASLAASLGGLVAYDQRLVAAARAAGMATWSPA